MAVGLGFTQFRRHSIANSRFVHVHWGKEAFRNLLKSGFVFSVYFAVLLWVMCSGCVVTFFNFFVNACYECTESAVVSS